MELAGATVTYEYEQVNEYCFRNLSAILGMVNRSPAVQSRDKEVGLLNGEVNIGYSPSAAHPRHPAAGGWCLQLDVS